MQEKYLHIVTHDVPWPADFGGVIDLFYKLRTLHQNGIKIYLHCYTNNRKPQKELENYCEKVFYYKRQKNLLHFSFGLPFIVSSRKSHSLLRNLQKDNHPILLEGIHCTYQLYEGKLNDRKVLLRLHNAEFEYYHHLALHEKNPVKKFYFYHESKLLKKYENKIAKSCTIIAVSDHDLAIYKAMFDADKISYLPVFLPYTSVEGKEGKGCFCLYHANLSINENEEAAIWLLQNIFNGLDIPFVIAGKNPSQKLTFLAEANTNVCLIANPSDKDLDDLIAKAQINVLPSFNNTGVKLKLLNALFNGRHCLVNKAGVEGSGLYKFCSIAEDENDFKSAIKQLYTTTYTKEECFKRDQLLTLYDNQKNAEKIITLIWPPKN